jgi:hypothetical protein
VSVGEDTNILSYDDAFEIPEGAFEAFQWACGSGLLGGEARVLEPNKVLTRAELVMSLYDFAKWLQMDVSVGEDTNILSFNDAMKVSDWAMAAIQWAVGSGLMEGDGVNLKPISSATRCESAALLMRFLEDITKTATTSY